jgi:hypothetical protein
MSSKKAGGPEQQSVRGKQIQSSGNALALRRHWRKATVKLLVISLVILAISIWMLNSNSEPSNALVPSNSAISVASSTAKNLSDLSVPTPVTSKEQQRLALTQQLELVDETLCNYRKATQYPNSSRPISEHPDQVYPNRPVEEQHAMRKEGGGTDPAVLIQTTQSRVFMVAGETVLFTIKALNKEGNTLPMYVNRTVASGITFQGNRPTPQLAVSITDEGSNGDMVAGDGVFSGVLAPAQSGFASFAGTIRTELKYTVDGRAGVVLFDVIYSPEIPATWTGAIRETTEGGSLNFYLKTNVHTPGRYVVSGRVDDAKGKPVALVSFNDMVAQGNSEIRLTVVGKLLRDQAPVFPLSLRDVDAYLLKENTDPDRALMPRLEGVAHVTKNYALKNFSDAEWQSEERSRYLTEYSKDVELAKAALVAFDPEQARLPFPQSECSKEKAH